MFGCVSAFLLSRPSWTVDVCNLKPMMLSKHIMFRNNEEEEGGADIFDMHFFTRLSRSRGL